MWQVVGRRGGNRCGVWKGVPDVKRRYWSYDEKIGG
jgi:hypothetical protein